MDIYDHAIDALLSCDAVVRTNEPINRIEGNDLQADLEREASKDYQSAIQALRFLREAKYQVFARLMKASGKTFRVGDKITEGSISGKITKITKAGIIVESKLITYDQLILKGRK